MGNRIDETMEKIRAGLADLPEGAVRRALNHYREYIAEALEAGRTEDEILRRLGNPEEIIAQVRAESSLDRAEQKPGPVRLTGAARETVGGIASTAGKISLAIGASVPYTLAMGLYLTAVGSFLGALAAAGLMAYGVSEIAPGYIGEKIGAAGVGVLAAALLTAAGLLLWQAANAITRFTLGLLRRDLPGGAARGRDAAGSRPAPGGSRKAFLVCGVAAALGLGLVVPSGLPWRCFMIWNSMKPDFVVRAGAYRAADVREIEVNTLNSMIVLKVAGQPAQEIRVSYEESDWMTGNLAVSGDKLVFREESRGRIPFLDFIARHEGMTSVIIEAPPEYRARAVVLTSKGGHISIAPSAGNIRAGTLTGNVRFDACGGSFAVRAASRNGGVFVGGRPVDGGVYISGAGAENTVEIESVDGTVTIEGIDD